MPRSALLMMRATTRPPLTEVRDAPVKAVTSSPLTQNGYFVVVVVVFVVFVVFVVVVVVVYAIRNLPHLRKVRKHE